MATALAGSEGRSAPGWLTWVPVDNVDAARAPPESAERGRVHARPGRPGSATPPTAQRLALLRGRRDRSTRGPPALTERHDSGERPHRRRPAEAGAASSSAQLRVWGSQYFPPLRRDRVGDLARAEDEPRPGKVTLAVSHDLHRLSSSIVKTMAGRRMPCCRTCCRPQSIAEHVAVGGAGRLGGRLAG